MPWLEADVHIGGFFDGAYYLNANYICYWPKPFKPPTYDESTGTWCMKFPYISPPWYFFEEGLAYPMTLGEEERKELFGQDVRALIPAPDARACPAPSTATAQDACAHTPPPSSPAQHWCGETKTFADHIDSIQADPVSWCYLEETTKASLANRTDLTLGTEVLPPRVIDTGDGTVTIVHVAPYTATDDDDTENFFKACGTSGAPGRPTSPRWPRPPLGERISANTSAGTSAHVLAIICVVLTGARLTLACVFKFTRYRDIRRDICQYRRPDVRILRARTAAHRDKYKRDEHPR